ncbi:hypothetical protein LMG27952_03937 [Paraburkholderia hiiakae]|uniref:Uncharacterized protein n=1 Tax=Paraburkholderia hiiakae TaxID=1081782 RepID=A0ABM8NTH0_9BURK|nr:hypothetical protein [Paraburkholderia hiiakae]CAD6542780.1 hypothetical protein LMG27952_03937 [Paraburkholderia hiiakae]
MTHHWSVRLSACFALALLSLTLVLPNVCVADDEPDTSTTEPQTKVNWADRIREAKVQKGEPINLIVHTAKDCVFCRRWEGSLGGKGDFESWAKTHPDVHLFIVEREAIAFPETVDNYPPDVQWLFERRQRADKLKLITPTFEIFVRRKMVFKSNGLRSWDQIAFPSLKDLDSRRSASASE